MDANERNGVWIKREREKRGLTQGQLGEKIGYARESISHWEREMPAASKEHIILLENAFREMDGLNTSSEDSFEDIPIAEALPVEADEPRVEQKTEHTKWHFDTGKVLVIAVFIVIILLLIILIEMPKQQKAETVTSTPVRLTKEWFMTEPEVIEGKPYIEMEFTSDPIKACRGYGEPDGLGWMYTLYFTETNGYDFHVEYILEYHFIAGFAGDPFEHYTEPIEDYWGSTLFVGHDRKEWSGGFPVQDIEAIGYIIVGTDSSGNRMEFWEYAELSPEIRE